MKLLLSCMVSLTCTFSGIWALSNFFSIQKSEIWLRFLSVTIISVLQGLMCIFGIPILNTISMLAMIVLSTIICFRIPKISFLIYDFLIALICFIADAMSTLSLSFVTQKTISSAVAEDSLTISSCLRTCLLTFILCHIVFSMIRKKKSSFVWYESISICNFKVTEKLSLPPMHHRKYCKYAFRNILGFLFNRLYCVRCLHCFCILSCFCDSGNGKEKRIVAAANRYANGSLS